MRLFADISPMFGLLGFYNGEIFLVMAVLVVLFGSGRLPRFFGGLGQGLKRFRDATDEVAEDAGRSLSGIYGNAAAEALTPDNHVAELYKPGVFQKNSRRKRPTKRLADHLRRCLRLFKIFLVSKIISPLLRIFRLSKTR